jgi:DNA-binding NtrC family response regulator
VEFSADVLDCLIKYSWPGNVRELQSCVEYAVILCQGDMIGFEHLPEEIQKAGSDIKGYNILGKQQELRNMIFEVEKNKIIESLKETGGNRTKAIEKLGISRRTFYRKLKAYNINPDLYTK